VGDGKLQITVQRRMVGVSGEKSSRFLEDFLCSFDQLGEEPL
jgi:hypothetical protein